VVVEKFLVVPNMSEVVVMVLLRCFDGCYGVTMWLLRSSW